MSVLADRPMNAGQARVRDFEYVEATPRLALARLTVDLFRGEALDSRVPTLVAVGHRAHRLAAVVDPDGWESDLGDGRSRWRLAFPLPLHILEERGVRFLLELPGSVLVPLPAPELRRLAAPADAGIWVAGGRLGMVAALLAAGAIALGAHAPDARAQDVVDRPQVLTESCPAGGVLPDGSTCAVPTPDCPETLVLPDGRPCVYVPPAERSSEKSTEASTEQETPAETPAEQPAETPAASESEPQVKTEAGREKAEAPAKSKKKPASKRRRATSEKPEKTDPAARHERAMRRARAERRAALKQRRAERRAENREAEARERATRVVEPEGHDHSHSGGAVVLPGLAVQDAPEPPGFLKPIYKAAGRKHGVPWQVLASINEIETQYGRLLGPSPAGALGWMQFMPATWQAFGVDANGDGRKDPDNPRDAIFAAARYLEASGARKDLPRAIYAYNHAEWYVQAVLLRAREMRWRDPKVTKLLRLRRWQLERKVLADERIEIYGCGREDIAKHRIDRRVLLTLRFLADAGFHPTVSSLQCGRDGIYTKSGNISHHVVGAAVDISAINGEPILGNQGPGSLTEAVVRRLLTLHGFMAADQIISLIEVRGARSTIAMGDHADHIHIGFRPRRDVRAVRERIKRLKAKQARDFAMPERRPWGILPGPE